MSSMSDICTPSMSSMSDIRTPISMSSVLDIHTSSMSDIRARIVFHGNLCLKAQWLPISKHRVCTRTGLCGTVVVPHRVLA